MARLPRDMILSYRQTFDYPGTGKLVLADLLANSGILKRIDSEEQRVRHNMGIELLEALGAVQGLNWERLVECILNLTVPTEAVEEQVEHAGN